MDRHKYRQTDTGKTIYPRALDAGHKNPLEILKTNINRVRIYHPFL